jgi:hypothetical protein
MELCIPSLGVVVLHLEVGDYADHAAPGEGLFYVQRWGEGGQVGGGEESCIPSLGVVVLHLEVGDYADHAAPGKGVFPC